MGIFSFQSEAAINQVVIFMNIKEALIVVENSIHFSSKILCNNILSISHPSFSVGTFAWNNSRTFGQRC